MSVITEADEQIKEAKNGVDVAIRAISLIVVDECWGSEEYGREYIALLTKILVFLIDIRGYLK